ncbi:unnamed protein product [Pieris macdunnoughi]|uniref:Uncharacterized protein n=1 Tax=Pieris macdunnoughi TaxID=345717 RepID=A0A821NQJ7_9NEOP|nr:unnamed protein product [Pieris macdunnoughi]
MQAAPTRYVSASELYSTDEVELLLEEIRELEPTSCRGEEGQDLEIAGSFGGGRSPAGTELTERSWDSHAHYSRAPPPRPQPLAPVYCRPRYFCSSFGALTLLLVVCSGTVCILVWAALGLRGAEATRPLMFGALTTFLAHTLLLVLHLTALTALFPLDFTKWSGWLGAWSACWLTVGAGLALRPLTDVRFLYSPALIYSAVGVGWAGACAGAALAWLALRAGCVRAGGTGRGGSRRSSGPAAYRAVPQASSSRDDPL